MTARRVSQSVLVLVALAVICAGLGGCQEEQLKAQVVDLQTRLRYVEDEKGELNQKLTQAEAKNTQLQSETTAAKVEAARAMAELADLKKKAGAPPPPPPPPPGAEKVFTLADPFTSGNASLKTASAAELSRIAAQIKRDYPGGTIRVQGHTDSDPIKKSGWKDNWELSCERALTVVRQLTKSGIDSKNICAAGFGQHRPVADNASRAGKSRNRRVEIVVAAQ